MEPINREEVLRIVKARGPIIPNELKRALGKGDTMLLGAILSELASKGLVRISHTKLGGSPFYYDPARPESLERVAHHLNEKDQKTWQRLRAARVLRDDEQDALTRVSLRNLKDYARQLHVKNEGGTITYWKYYLVTDEEAEALIRKELEKKRREGGREKEGVKEKENGKEKWWRGKEGGEVGRRGEGERSCEREAARTQPPAPPASSQATIPAGERGERRREGEKRRGGEERRGEARKEPAAPREATATPPPARQQTLAAKGGAKSDSFAERVKHYFAERGITVREERVVRRGNDLEFIIELPTPVGAVDYFCKAKRKKKSNEGDLAAAKLRGNAKQLPVLYVTTGELTKKARELLKTEYKGVVVKELR